MESTFHIIAEEILGIIVVPCIRLSGRPSAPLSGGVIHRNMHGNMQIVIQNGQTGSIFVRCLEL